MVTLWNPSMLAQYAQLARRPSKRHVAGLLLAVFLLIKLRQKILAKQAALAVSHKNGPPVPGFTALSDQIYVRNPDEASASASAPSSDDGDSADPATPEGHPDVVMVYGWGDCLPKHVVKYTDGFRALYPRAKQILVLSPIAKAMFTDLHQRTQLMVPIVKELFPEGPSAEGAPRTILAHTMSNTGAVNYAATINAFKEMHDAPFPHQLLSMDSTPGSTDLSADNLVRWSRAMALGTAGFFPWPFLVTQSIFGLFLLASGTHGAIIGRESAGTWSRKAANNEAWETKLARKLYMYSKEDDLIRWQDIEVHVAETRRLGWQADVEVFAGTGHVGHMRQHGEQYWAAIRASWERAMAMQV